MGDTLKKSSNDILEKIYPNNLLGEEDREDMDEKLLFINVNHPFPKDFLFKGQLVVTNCSTNFFIVV